MNPMDNTSRAARREQVVRIFNENGWEGAIDLDDWDGEDLEALRDALGEEQFQALLDELAEAGAHDR